MVEHMLRTRLLVAGIVAVCAGFAVYFLVPRPLPEFTRSEFLSEVRSGHVSRVAVDEDHIFTAKSTTRGAFRVMSPSNERELLSELHARGVEVVYEKSAPGLI